MGVPLDLSLGLGRHDSCTTLFIDGPLDFADAFFLINRYFRRSAG